MKVKEDTEMKKLIHFEDDKGEKVYEPIQFMNRPIQFFGELKDLQKKTENEDETIEQEVSQSPDVKKELKASEKPSKFVSVSSVRNFEIWVDEEITEIDDYVTPAEKKIFVVWNIYFQGEENKVKIPIEKCGEFSWVSKATCGRARLDKENKMNFSKEVYYKLDAGGYKKSVVFTTSGWKSLEGNYYYAHSEGLIGIHQYPGRGASEFKICAKWKEVGSRKIFNDYLKVLKVCRNFYTMTVPVLYFHASLMTSLFEEARFPIKFLLAVIGVSNSKKTSLVLDTLRLFNTDKLEPDASFSSTQGGIETMLSKYNDAILLIDDYMPATSKSRQNALDAKLDDITRFFGDRTTKKRMYDFSPNAEKKVYKIKGGCVITGEQIRGVQSALARMITIEIDRNEVINSNLKFFRDNYEIVPTHAVDFIKYVSGNYEKIIEFIKKNSNIDEEIPELQMPRLRTSFVVLKLTLHILTQYIKDRNFMNELEIENFMKYMREGAKHVLLMNDAKLQEQDIGTVIMRAMDWAMTQKSLPVIQLQNINQKGDYIIRNTSTLMVRADILYKLSLQYIQHYNIPVGLVDKSQVLAALEASEVLIYGKKGEKSRKLPNNLIDGRRYLYINGEKMKKLLEKTDK